MELKCIKQYQSATMTVKAGLTTEGMELTDEQKEQLLSDFPHKFEAIEEVTEPVVTEPEDKSKDITAQHTDPVVEAKVPDVEIPETRKRAPKNKK
jgi:hypothetical protein